MQAYSASLRGKFASQTLPPPYGVKKCAVRQYSVCSYRLFEKREDNILPYRGYTNFYGFTPKFVLHFVGTDVLGGPLKQTARSIITAANL